MLSVCQQKVNCILEFFSVETDFSQSHFLISRMCFSILSCLRLFCLLVELEALPEALLPQTGLVQIIPTHQPGLSSQSSQACFPPAVSTAVLLTLWGPLNTKQVLCICLPASVSSPFASSSSPHTTPNSPHPYSLCFPSAQQPSPQELCTKRCLHAHICTTAPTHSLDLYNPGHWVLAWIICSLSPVFGTEQNISTGK